MLESATSHRDEESEWSEITHTGSPTEFVLGLSSSAAVLHSWATKDARWSEDTWLLTCLGSPRAWITVGSYPTLGQGWVSTICLGHSLAGVIFLYELSALSQQGALEHS